MMKLLIHSIDVEEWISNFIPNYTGHVITTKSAKVRLILETVSNIRRTLVGYKIVDHSDVAGALPVGAAPTTSSFST